jgi:hypothetical protein
MKRPIRVLSFAVLGFSAILASAQGDKGQRPSPSAQTQCKFSDGKTITVDYSSPRRNGRKIVGGLVPYGQVWRTGANEATTLVTDTNLTVGGKDVPAGNYTLFTLPEDKDRWTLIISKKTGEWGIPYPEGEDFTRADMKITNTPSPSENFTIAFDQAGGNCTLNLSWESTMASSEFAEKK